MKEMVLELKNVLNKERKGGGEGDLGEREDWRKMSH